MLRGLDVLRCAVQDGWEATSQPSRLAQPWPGLTLTRAFLVLRSDFLHLPPLALSPPMRATP